MTKNISLDLIFNYPGQKFKELKRDVKFIKKLNPYHISAYDLIIEDGTRINYLINKNILPRPSSDTSGKYYEYIIKYLKKYGYNQYEISSFAKYGFESIHNKIYWENKEYYGLGLSAVGFINNIEISQSKNFNNYLNNIDITYEKYCNNDLLKREIMMGLRCIRGINIKKINSKYNKNIIKLFPKIFLYTFIILSSLIILTHIIIYYSFQIIYLENKKEEIKRTANKLSENIADFEKNEIYNSLKLFSKNNDVKVFVKNGNSKDDVRIDENIGINSKSKYNSIIIEEKTVKTKTNDEITLQFIFSKDIEEEAKNISLKFLPYTLLLSFVFSIIISYFYTKIIISPIFEITKVTDNMMKLDRNALLKVNTEDEIGHLKGQINILYTRLLGVIDNLDKKNKEIIKFEKTKVDFLRSTSHELKTPLASLKVILENMKYNVRKI